MWKIKIKIFSDPPSRLKANILYLPPHKSRNFSDPSLPPVWIEKLINSNETGKVRY
jgi:hypothetical protein